MKTECTYRVPTDVVDPAPVGVEHDGALLGLAVATGRALLDGDAGVVLRGEGANLLTVGGREEGESEECDGGEHLEASRGRRVVWSAESSMQTVDQPRLLL